MYDEHYFPQYARIIIWMRGPLYNKIPLYERSDEFRIVKDSMRMQDIEIRGIWKIENKSIQRSYELKKNKKRLENPYVTEILLFHGTTETSMKKILMFNFDWRKWGSRSHRCYYGRGVYFTPDATVSSRYPRASSGFRFMIFCKVLFERSVVGNPYVELPFHADSTTSTNFEEIVKYEDNEFCPTHLIVFKMKDNDQDKSCLTLDGAVVKHSTSIIRAQNRVLNSDEIRPLLSSQEAKNKFGRSLLLQSKYESFTGEEYTSRGLNLNGKTVFGSSLDDQYSDSDDSISNESFDDWEIQIGDKKSTLSSHMEELLKIIMGNIISILKFFWFRMILGSFPPDSYSDSDNDE